MEKSQILVKRFEDFFREEGLDTSLGKAFNEAYQVRLGDTIVFCDDSKDLVASLRGKSPAVRGVQRNRGGPDEETSPFRI